MRRLVPSRRRPRRALDLDDHDGIDGAADADALLSLQQQVTALGVQLVDERRRGAGVGRVTGALEQWIQHKTPRPPSLVDHHVHRNR